MHRRDKEYPGYGTDQFYMDVCKNIYNFVDYLIVDGKVNLNQDDDIIASTLVTMNGKVVHAGALEAMELA